MLTIEGSPRSIALGLLRGGLLGLLLPILTVTAAQATVPPASRDTDAWFENFKQQATDEELYRLLYAMPKGGDLHNHISGAILDDWFYDLALAQSKHGYHFLTRVRIDNCRDYGGNAFGRSPYLLLFHTIQDSAWQQLSPCEQREYKPLENLSERERSAWLNAMVLDKAHEGRQEFFETHWQRMNHLSNPYLLADALVRNMQAFAREGLIYFEPMVSVHGLRPDGTPFTLDEVANIYRERLAQPDALATGVTVRLQVAILRFAPNAEDSLRELYAFVAHNRDLWVAVNMVGREDNDKGHPLRFLDTLRELRQRHHGVRLSIHGGEVDEPNDHVRDTLLLGADRIGHGVNLITDPDTLRLMRHGPYLVEINLISNLLLEYVDDYDQHPFPEYLRTGIPVALSTDDRGMWDSNLTDEFFVAVREFNLSWSELTQLSRASLQHAFAPEDVRARLLAQFTANIEGFELGIATDPLSQLAKDARSHGFMCRRYALCQLTQTVSGSESGPGTPSEETP